MRIHNVHERTLPIDARAAWALVDSLGGPDDRLWPVDRWPRMRIAGDLGRHAFVRYRVVGREPGQRLRFRFRDMPGLEGEHGFEVVPAGDGASVLRHVLDAEARGAMALKWRLVISHLHDALLEDLLDRAEGVKQRRHPLVVRALYSLGGTTGAASSSPASTFSSRLRSRSRSSSGV